MDIPKLTIGSATNLCMLILGISSPMFKNLFVIEGFDVTSYCFLVFHLPRSFGDKSLKVFKPLLKWDAMRKAREKYLCRSSIEVKVQITFVSKVCSANFSSTQSLIKSRVR